MKTCEGCGTFGPGVEYINVHTTNGVLHLCRQCLDDINRKNPQLKALLAWAREYAMPALERVAARVDCPYCEYVGRALESAPPEARTI